MKVETMVAFGAAFGSAGLATQRQSRAEARNPDADTSRRDLRAPTNALATQDFALAMRRVEAECYDNL